jgi:hypothetical protein
MGSENPIYIGIFGKEYSDTTIKEYREAVKRTKPIFIYAKKMTKSKRDPTLSKFLDEEVKGFFKIHYFINKEDLFVTVCNNLKEYLFSLLKKGLEEHKRKIKKNSKIAREVNEKLNLNNTETNIGKELLIQAARYYEQKDYTASFMRAFIAIESWLRKSVIESIRNMKDKSINIRKIEKASIRDLLEYAQVLEVFNHQEISGIKDLIPTRNEVVHNGYSPSESMTRFVLAHASKIIER